jgi:hypothetical protein
VLLKSPIHPQFGLLLASVRAEAGGGPCSKLPSLMRLRPQRAIALAQA